MSKLPTYEEFLNVVSKLIQLEKGFEQLEQKRKLLERNVEQFKRNAELWKKKAGLFEERANLLQRENDILKDKLAKYETPKNSNNSSVPPSKDENRAFKSKSLRKKTGRKPGGQKGHEGTTLEMVSDPDKIIDHAPEYCACCGKDLTDTPGEFVERKQVVDIPPIKPKIGFIVNNYVDK